MQPRQANVQLSQAKLARPFYDEDTILGVGMGQRARQYIQGSTYKTVHTRQYIQQACTQTATDPNGSALQSTLNTTVDDTAAFECVARVWCTFADEPVRILELTSAQLGF